MSMDRHLVALLMNDNSLNIKYNVLTNNGLQTTVYECSNYC